jgi:hypothetical protein
LLLLVFAKKLITTLFFEKNAIFFAENWHRLQKMDIDDTWSESLDRLISIIGFAASNVSRYVEFF